MELHEVMRTAFSAREFTDDPVPDELLHRIFEQARFAPSGGNRQGGHVIVVRDEATKRALAERACGTVCLKIKVLVDGSAEHLEIAQAVEGYPEFSEAAIAVLPRWRFAPATKEGEPVACEILVPVKFALDEAPTTKSE